jgi:hypothetical protein
MGHTVGELVVVCDGDSRVGRGESGALSTSPAVIQTGRVPEGDFRRPRSRDRHRTKRPGPQGLVPLAALRSHEDYIGERSPRDQPQ